MARPELTTGTMPVACFAPPLTEEIIERYRSIANALPDSQGDVRDAMRECLAAVDLWWSLPESPGQPSDSSLILQYRGKETLIKVVSLTPDLKEQLWDAIPWPYELNAMQQLFDTIPEAERDLRNAAFHLLWYARELCCNREPLTQNVLKA